MSLHDARRRPTEDAMRTELVFASTLCALTAGCGGPMGGSRAFVDAENAIGDGKEDTGYQSSLDAVEVEVDIEGDVQADAFSIERAPLDLGQFALTHLRKNNEVFLQSLAEDFSHGTDKI